MISEAELRGLARRWNVGLMLLDLDYSLGCFLAGISRLDLAHSWRFKGGTCLRKCYFPDYRFSEDLDFTAEAALSEEDLKANIESALRWVEREIGLDFSTSPFRLETIEDEYGAESFEVRLYYRGALSRTGSPQAIRSPRRHSPLRSQRSQRAIFLFSAFFACSAVNAPPELTARPPETHLPSVGFPSSTA